MSSLYAKSPVTVEPEETAESTRTEALDETVRYITVIAIVAAVANLQIWSNSGAGAAPAPFWFNAILAGGFGLQIANGRAALRVRAAILVAWFYAAAVGALMVFGLGGSGTAFLLGAGVLAAIFFGIQAGMAVGGLAVATGVAAAFLLLGGHAQLLLAAQFQNTSAAWLSVGGNLALVIVALIVPQRHLWESQAFVIAISKQKQELLDARAALQKQTRQLEMASAELAGANVTLQEQSFTLERRAQQLTAAAEIGRAATSTFDLPTLLETSVNLIRDRFGFYHASVFIVAPGSDMAELRASTGEAGRELKARKHKLAIGSKSLVGTATSTRQPIIVQDVTADPNYYPNPLLPDTRGEAVLPLLRGDTVIGAVDVQSTLPNAFAESDLAILSTIADQLAVAVQNASLYTETQAALSENAALFKISATLAEADSLQDILDVVTQNAMPRVATRAALAVVHAGPDGQSADLEVRAYYDAEGKLQRTGLHVPIATVPLMTKLTFTPLAIPDIYTDPRVDAVTRETLAKLDMISVCAVPLRVSGQLIGIILVSGGQPAEFSIPEINLLRSVTDQVVVTMEKLRLLEETRRRAEQSAAAADIGRAATATFDLPTLLETSVNLIRNRFGFYHASVFIVEPGSNVAELRESTGEAGRKLKERKHKLAIGSKSLVGTATSTHQPVIVQDVRADPNYYPNPLLPDTRAEAVLPMLSGDVVIGAVDVQSTTPNIFVESEIAILSTIVGQLAVAIQNARLYAETRARLGELGTLNELSRAFASTLDIEQVYQAVREQVATVMGTGDIYLAQYDEAQDLVTFSFIIERGQSVEIAPKAPAGLTAHIIQTRQPLLLQGTAEEVKQQAEALGAVTYEQGASLSFFGVPLTLGQRVIGVLAVQDFDRLNAFDVNSQRIMTTIAGQLAVALQNARLFAQTQATLAETEGLYQASADLNTATAYDGILNILRKYTIAGDGTSIVSLSLFDTPATSTSKPETIEAIAFWASLPPEQAARLPRRFRVADFPAFETALHPDKATVVEDFATTAIMSDASRGLYQKVLGAESTVFAPLKVGDQWIGYVNLLYREPRKFPEASIRQLMVLTGQAAVALNSLRLFEETRNALAENATLFKISRALSEVESTQGIMEVIAANAMPQGATRTGLLWVHYNAQGEPTEVEIRAHVDITGRHNQRLGLRIPAAAGPFLSRLPPEPLVIPNIDTYPLLDPVTRETMRQMLMISTCLIPLFMGGRLSGIITTSASELVEFQPREVNILRGMADLVTVTLEKLRLLAETQRRAEQLAAASDIGRAATASFDLPSVLATTVNLIRDRFGFYHASIFIIDPASNVAELRESTGEAGRELKARKHKLAVGSKSLVGTATATRQAVVVQDVQADPTYYPNPLLPDTHAEAVIPLIAGDMVVGAIDVQSTTRGTFTEGDIAVLSTIAGQLAVAVQNARLYAQTARWATRERMANQITNKIRSVGAGDVDGMLRTAVTELRQALGTSHGVVHFGTGSQRPEPALATTGQVKMILDQIIAERGSGDQSQIQTVRNKLMLKGVNPDHYTADMPDDPAVLAQIKQIAAEMRVAVKIN